MRRWPTLTSLCLTLLLGACAGPLTSKVEPPQVSVAGLGLGRPGLFEQELRVDLRLVNPNDFDVDVDSLKFNLEVNEIQFARGQTAADFELPALGETVVPVDVLVPTNDLIDRMMQVGGGESLSYRLTGTAELGGLLGIPIPFEREGELALPRLPGLTAPGS